MYFRDGKTSDLQCPDIITTYDGCVHLSKPPAQTSLENSPGFGGDFAVPSMSDTICVQCAAQELLLSWHLTCGRAPQLQPPEHRLCDRRRGTAEDFFSQFGQPLNVLRETSCQGYFQFCCLFYPKLRSWHISKPS